VPASWPQFKVHYYQTFYHLLFIPKPTHDGLAQLLLDGEPVRDGRLMLMNDHCEHTVEVFFGHSEVERSPVEPNVPLV
jgi:hypothetical protein